jgi:hypothetical protein
LKDGSGRGGTVQWRNGGRWFLNYTLVAKKDKKKADSDTDDGDEDEGARTRDALRELVVHKKNYGRKAEAVKLRWRNGVFVPVVPGSPIERAAVAVDAEEAFLRCLAAHPSVSPNRSNNFAPVVFATMPEASGVSKDHLEAAMHRLRARKVIEVFDDKRSWRIRRVNQ